MPAFRREQRHVLLVVHWLQLEKISAVVAHVISRMAARAHAHTHTHLTVLILSDRDPKLEPFHSTDPL